MNTFACRLRACFAASISLAALASLAACTNDETAPLPRPLPTASARHDLTPTIVVTNTNDAGAGSLRDAIAGAIGGDVIGFDPSIAGQTITLSTGQLEISQPITIVGSQTSGMVISGGGTSRVFFIEFLNQVTLRNLTITGGKVTGLDNGGGIEVQGTLTLDHSVVSGNNAGGTGWGGGIFVDVGTLNVTNTTIAKNTADLGGGIYLNSGNVVATNTTITDNTASNGGGVRSNGGAITNLLTLANTIVALNHNGGDCALGGSVAYTGMNLASDNTCSVIANAPVIVAADPKLASLADNGGPTQTAALLAGSPAIDAAKNCTVTDDQRYVTRPLGSACDIGAYEFDNRPSVTLSIDASAAVNPSTGTVVVTGTLTCSAAVTVKLQVSISQEQKVRRIPATVQASDGVAIDCVTSKPWSIALSPVGGAFVTGTASVTAQTANASSEVAPVSTAATVKLFYGHR